eukprot:gene35177-54954_t
MNAELDMGIHSDTLGVMMTHSVFSVHLKKMATQVPGTFFELDLSDMGRYAPIPGYAALGGKAVFRLDGRWVRTHSLTYGCKTFINDDDGFQNEDTRMDYANSKLTGWRFAEKAIIASLLSQTNLVQH